MADNELQRAFNDLLTSVSPADRRVITLDIRQRATQRRRDAILAYVESPEVLERRQQTLGASGRVQLSGAN